MKFSLFGRKYYVHQNVGGLDSAIRILLGVVIVGIGIYNERWGVLIGFIPFLTGIARWCPIYEIFGIGMGVKNDCIA